MDKVQSKRSKKNKESEGNNPIKWIILTIVYIVILMWLYGMTRIYFPNPIHIGGGQYFDIGIGILLFGVALYGVILGYLLKKLNRKNKKRR